MTPRGIAIATALLIATSAGAQLRVYGGELMSEEELAAYQATLGSLHTPEERAAFRIEHRKQMDLRARQQGVTLGRRPAAREPGPAPVDAAGATPADAGTPEAPRRAPRGRRPVGWELMTDAEREAYRETLRTLETQEERRAFREQHREEMEARAREQGVALRGPAGPARRVYGQRFMSPEEVRDYWRTFTSLGSNAERRDFQQRHMVEMQRRAREQGVELPPPAWTRGGPGPPP